VTTLRRFLILAAFGLMILLFYELLKSGAK